MKEGFRSFAVVLGAAVLALCIFPAASAFAQHDHEIIHPPGYTGPTTVAKEAHEANTEEAMSGFTFHVRAHMEYDFGRGGLEGAKGFQLELRQPPWKHDFTYAIYMDPDTGVVSNHPKDQKALIGISLDNFPVVKNLRSQVMKQKGNPDPVCAQYDRKGTTRWACAVLYTEPRNNRRFMFLVGFDHEVDDSRIIPIECPDHEKPRVTAEDVEKNPDKETLKMFVKEAIRVIKLSFGAGRTGYKVLNCFYSDKTLKSGSVYVYIMTSSTSVILNGNNPDLAGTSFRDIYDEDFVDISQAIIRTATADQVGGFIEYKWDNPAVDGDEISEKGKAAGTSRKIAYVEGMSGSHFGSGRGSGRGADLLYIVGSGYYPSEKTTEPMKPTEVDTGCAVAGAGRNSANSAFGIFLAVFSICFVLCAGSRAEK